MSTRSGGIARGLGLVALVVALLVGLAPAVAAQDDEIEPRFAAPVVIVNQTSFEPGDEVVVTIAGFRSRSVTVYVCGNEARRGSGDCDNIGAKAAELNEDGTSTVMNMTMTAPPLPCPCVLRVQSRDSDEVALALVTVIGHPTAPVIGSELTFDEPLDVGLSVARASSSIGSRLLASLGGSTEYDVSVTVRNRSTSEVTDVNVDAWAERGNSVIENVAVGVPETLAAGEVWEDVIRVELGAPHYGSVDWRIDAGSANAATAASRFSTSNLPVLLIALLLFLVADLLVLAVRLLNRLRRGPEDPEPDERDAVIDLTGAEPLVTAHA